VLVLDGLRHVVHQSSGEVLDLCYSLVAHPEVVGDVLLRAALVPDAAAPALRGVLAFADRHVGRVSVLLSCEVSQWSRTQATFAPLGSYEARSLDDVTEDFVAGVGRVAMAAFGVTAPRVLGRGLVRRALEDDQPLVALVAGLWSHRGETLSSVSVLGDVHSGRREEEWARQYEALKERGDDDVVRLIQLLGVLSQCGVETVPDDTVRCYAREFLGIVMPGRYETARSRLLGASWCTERYGVLSFVRGRFARAVEDVAPGSHGERLSASSYVRDFYVWTARAMGRVDDGTALLVLAKATAVVDWLSWPSECVVVLGAWLLRGEWDEYDLVRFLRCHKILDTPAECMRSIGALLGVVVDGVGLLRRVGAYVCCGSGLLEVDYPWPEAWPVFVGLLCGGSSVVPAGVALRVLELLTGACPERAWLLDALVVFERERGVAVEDVGRVARLRAVWCESLDSDEPDAGA